MIGGKFRGREEGSIRGFNRAIGVRLREGLKGFVGCFFRYCEVISYVNILAVIRPKLRVGLDWSSLGGTLYNLFSSCLSV